MAWLSRGLLVVGLLGGAGALTGACAASGDGNAGGAGGAGGAAEGEDSTPASTSAAEGTLRARFPELWGRVLSEGLPLSRTGDGFAPSRAAGAGRGRDLTSGAITGLVPLEQSPWQTAEPQLDVSFPERGDGAIVIRTTAADGAAREVRVYELDATGPAAHAGNAVAYARPHGWSYWNVTGDRAEEWLVIEAGVAHEAATIAAWSVEGGTPRETDEGVTIDGEDGSPQLHVTAPEAFTVTGRPVRARLSVNGSLLELSVDADGEEVLVDPSWASAGSMVGARYEHTASLLLNGKVLVAGGYNSGSLATTSLYDPVVNSWTTAAPLSAARYLHTSTRLGNGKVAVVGGSAGGISLTSVELYDPATNTWAPAAPLGTPRSSHGATELADGRMLAVGGYSTVVLATAEVYDPATNTWSPTGPMLTARYRPGVTLLANGKVLVAGGSDGSAGYTATAEVYDPTTNTWSAAAPMATARYIHTNTLLPSGKVLVTGGYNSSAELASVEIYDPAANTWSPGSPLSVVRRDHTASLLQTGTVLIAGGRNSTGALSGAEIYDPTSNTWSPGGTLATPRSVHTAAVLTSGRVVVTAGLNVGQLSSSERFSGANGDACLTAAFCASGFCVDGVCCNTACSAGVCDACSVAAGGAVNGTCSLLTGTTCNDGNTCTQTDTCQAGVCTGQSPVVCAPSDQCHTAGTCNPATGVCSNPVKPNNSICNDGNACTQLDTCQAGACTGQNLVVCVAQDTCHDVGTCNPATGLCSNPNKPDGSTCNDGDGCTKIDTCQSGSCSGGSPVVCTAQDQCHDAGACNPATGLCSNPNKPNGAGCDDGDACTQTDTCMAGSCTGMSPVTCPAPDQCHQQGTCNPATGLCSNPNKPDGSACDDGALCTQTDTCQSGACTGGDPVTCTPSDDCHAAGACDPATGACTDPVKPDGASCDDGDGCSQTDTCQSGTCTGADPVVCPAPDQCHEQGTCNPVTGSCTTPTKADGTACDDGNACSLMNFCQGGTCSPGIPVVCTPQDDCHVAGTCQPDGECDNPVAPDGTTCTIGGTPGVCQAGTCEESSSTSSTGGSGGTGGTGAAGGSGGEGGQGGSGAAGGSGGSGGTGGSAGGPSDSPDPGGCGCRVDGDPSSPRNGLWLLAGLAVLAGARRRGARSVRNHRS